MENFNSNQFSEINNLRKDKDYLCVKYNPSSCGRLEFASLKKEVSTTGSEVQVLTASYVNTVSAFTLEYHYATNPENVVIEDGVYNTEIKNPESNGFVEDYRKKEIVSKILKMNSDSTVSNSSFHAGEMNDYRPVKLAFELGGVVFTTDYHEAANAYYCNVPFVFVLSREHLAFLQRRGGRAFKKEFFGKLLRLLK